VHRGSSSFASPDSNASRNWSATPAGVCHELVLAAIENGEFLHVKRGVRALGAVMREQIATVLDAWRQGREIAGSAYGTSFWAGPPFPSAARRHSVRTPYTATLPCSPARKPSIRSLSRACA
jgi:hypothetical protein